MMWYNIDFSPTNESDSDVSVHYVNIHIKFRHTQILILKLKLGFTGVTISCLISVLNIDYGYLLEPPKRAEIRKLSQYTFHLKIIVFTAVEITV